MVYTMDSKSIGRKAMRVRLSPWALFNEILMADMLYWLLLLYQKKSIRIDYYRRILSALRLAMVIYPIRMVEP